VSREIARRARAFAPFDAFFPMSKTDAFDRVPEPMACGFRAFDKILERMLPPIAFAFV